MNVEIGLYAAKYLAFIKRKMALDSHKHMKFPRKFFVYIEKEKFECCKKVETN